MDFYRSTQKKGIGNLVNNAGYEVLEQIDLNNLDVLEFGPGEIPHLHFWNGRPNHFYFADYRQEMLNETGKRLKHLGVPNTGFLLPKDNNGEISDLANKKVDVILSFYSLEHLYPLEKYLNSMLNLLKPNGLIVGAIPTEGGLGWGIGRYLTSRRWLEKNGISMEKIMCWEHPNFAETVLLSLESLADRKMLGFWPLKLPSIDLNLVIKFIYQKKSDT